MLSYKQWKTLNESFTGSFNLGVKSSGQVLGIQSPFASYGIELEEAKKAKKAKKKKMHGEEDETGDGEVVGPSSEKDEPEVDVDSDEGEEGEEGEEGDEKVSPCDEPKMCGKNAKKNSKKKMCSDEDEGEEDEDEEDGMEGEEDGEEDEEDEEDGEENLGKKPLEKDELQFSKKNAKKKSKKKMKSEATDDDADFLARIKTMMTFDPKVKYDDGFTQYYRNEE